MSDNKFFGNNVLSVDDEWGGIDYENLETPTKWRFDEATGKLHMLFKDGKTPRLIFKYFPRKSRRGGVSNNTTRAKPEYGGLSWDPQFSLSWGSRFF